MEFLMKHGMDLLQGLEHLVLALSFGFTLTKTKKDDEIANKAKKGMVFMKDFFARLISANK